MCVLLIIVPLWGKGHNAGEKRDKYKIRHKDHLVKSRENVC